MSIADRVGEAASLLRGWKQSIEPGCQQAEEAENQIFRFNIWTSNNSIIDSPRKSMDWILRNNPILLSTMEDLLDDLKSSLTVPGSTAHDGQRSTATDFSLMLEAIEDAIDQLFRFSRAIHRSGVDHRFVKLTNYVDYSTSGTNLLEEFIITARRLVEPLLRGMNITREMEDRLIETICLRRQAFAYIYAQKAQQAPRSEKSFRSRYLESALPPISSFTALSTQTAGVNAGFGYGEHLVTTLEADALGSWSWFPQRPAVPLGQKEWECQYCLQVCPVNEFSRGKWKEHVLEDIMPYICVLESCPTPNTLFKSTKAWVRHMTNDHISGTWTCMDTRHDTKLVFNGESEFKEHILECHLDQFEELDLDFLANSCFENKARDTPLKNCPFCPVCDVTDLSFSDLIDHVAQHLLNFARISLEGYFEKFNEQPPTFDLTEHNQVASNPGILGDVANELNFGMSLSPQPEWWKLDSNLAYDSEYTTSGYRDLNPDLGSDARLWGQSNTIAATSAPLGDPLGAFTYAKPQLHDAGNEADDNCDAGRGLDYLASSMPSSLRPSLSAGLSPILAWEQPLNLRTGYDPPSRGNDYVPSPNDMKTQYERKKRNEEIGLWSLTVGAANIETDDDATSNTANNTLRQGDDHNLNIHPTVHSTPEPDDVLCDGSDDDIISEHWTDWDTPPESLPAGPDEHRLDDFSMAGVGPSTASPSQPPQIFSWQDTMHHSMSRAPQLQPESAYAAMAAFQKRAAELDTESITATIDNNSVNNVALQLEQWLNITKTSREMPKGTLRHSMYGAYQESPIPVYQAPGRSLQSAKDTTRQADWEGERSSGNPFRHQLNLVSKSPSNELIRSPSPIGDNLRGVGGGFDLPKEQNFPLKTRGQSKGEMSWPTIHGGADSSNIKLEMDAEPSPGSLPPGLEEWQSDEDDKPNEAEEKGFAMGLTRVLPKPTLEGFEAYFAKLNPGMTPALINRFAQEQVLRYDKLIECRQQHMAAVDQGSCKSGKLCFGLGGQALLLKGRKGATDVWDADDYDRSYLSHEGAVKPDQFPPDIPLPPVSNLPAAFECPICFQVKTIHKPSDWSRHVLEDLQPYMCTFLGCTGPWFFKRKASWVRHESERHRRLRWWTCSYPGCTYTCTRRSTFIQHALREHDMLEPKGSVPDSGASKEHDRLSKLVEECEHETSSTLVNEPCRFCGHIFPTWRKLTGHLGLHMERLALPILDLVEQARISGS